MKPGMLVWTYWPGPEGGAERQCRLMVQEMSKISVKCTVYTSWHSWKSPRVSKEEGGVVYRFGILCPLEAIMRKRMVGTLGFWFLVPVVWLSRLLFMVELLFHSQRHPYDADVLHVHESGWLAGLGVWLGRRRKIPVLCKEATSPSLGEISFGTPFRKQLDKLRRQSGLWIAQTDHAKTDLMSKLPKEVPAVQIPNGVRIPETSADPEHSQEVLYVGNLTQGAAWKAFDILFEAWAMVAEKKADAFLRVVGEGNPEPWQSLLRKHGVEPSVHFEGKVDDPGRFYQMAGIFLLPSRIEGLSNALLEAQSFGLCCIVSDIPGNCAVVENGVNGRIVPVEDVSKLAHEILVLLENPEQRRQFGELSRQRIIREYASSSVANRLLQVYRDVGKINKETVCV